MMPFIFDCNKHRKSNGDVVTPVHTRIDDRGRLWGGCIIIPNNLICEHDEIEQFIPENEFTGSIIGVDYSNGHDFTVQLEGFMDPDGRLVIMNEKHVNGKKWKNIRQRINAGKIKLEEKAEKQYYQEQNKKVVKQQLLNGYHAYLRQFIPEEMHEFIDFSGVTWELEKNDYDARFNGETFELEIPGIERMGVILKMIPFPKEENGIGQDLECCKTFYVVPQIDFRSDGKPYTFTGVKYPVICIAEDFESYEDLDMALARTWEVTKKYREMLDSWHKNEREVHKQLVKQITDIVETAMRSRSGLPHELA